MKNKIILNVSCSSYPEMTGRRVFPLAVPTEDEQTLRREAFKCFTSMFFKDTTRDYTDIDYDIVYQIGEYNPETKVLTGYSGYPTEHKLSILDDSLEVVPSDEEYDAFPLIKELARKVNESVAAGGYKQCEISDYEVAFSFTVMHKRERPKPIVWTGIGNANTDKWEWFNDSELKAFSKKAPPSETLLGMWRSKVNSHLGYSYSFANPDTPWVATGFNLMLNDEVDWSDVEHHDIIVTSRESMTRPEGNANGVALSLAGLTRLERLDRYENTRNQITEDMYPLNHYFRVGYESD